MKKESERNPQQVNGSSEVPISAELAALLASAKKHSTRITQLSKNIKYLNQKLTEEKQKYYPEKKPFVEALLRESTPKLSFYSVRNGILPRVDLALPSQIVATSDSRKDYSKSREISREMNIEGISLCFYPEAPNFFLQDFHSNALNCGITLSFCLNSVLKVYCDKSFTISIKFTDSQLMEIYRSFLQKVVSVDYDTEEYDKARSMYLDQYLSKYAHSVIVKALVTECEETKSEARAKCYGIDYSLKSETAVFDIPFKLKCENGCIVSGCLSVPSTDYHLERTTELAGVTFEPVSFSIPEYFKLPTLEKLKEALEECPGGAIL